MRKDGQALIALGTVIALQAACSDTPSLTPSSPEAGPTAQYSLSGIVYEHTPAGRRALAFTPLKVRLWASGRDLLVTSDANGRYMSEGVPPGPYTIEPFPEQYMAPCPSGADGLISDAIVDVHVVSTAFLATAGVPRSLPRTGRRLVGSVYETTPEGPQPVPGALVSLEAHKDGFRFSSTLSNTRGEYLICMASHGMGNDPTIWISVQRAGYVSGGREVDLPEEPVWDVELTRKYP